MTRPPWNHNIHYHPRVLAAAPRACRRALDVGCGRGLLTAELTGVADEVVGIDPDVGSLARAQASFGDPKLSFVQADVITHRFEPATFDLVASIAVLHHLPLRPALARFCELLAPGGVLAVIGLYKGRRTPEELAMAAAAYPANQMLRRLKGEVEVGAPVMDPAETLPQIRAATADVLPGPRVRPLLLFRYELLWRKPA